MQMLTDNADHNNHRTPLSNAHGPAPACNGAV